ncbi:FAD/NAD(P)-binding protein [Thermincola potens]|uniref:Dihydroorotate dehydrogenase, electron transfer subunit, iron-sulfur cluster binding domain protein n=1 Tax=Thermincola potens (strain JR) TaxID=635013 RepID=D5XDF9_THEPJ|nr:FAD/NAD(P)-binding protein [Thermincola potens]ADG81807.1 Dihydroorotate dehydrogenase, electron transfer subunit, iron-sulfur cluster binding domain protein [Thermincola potens JR]
MSCNCNTREVASPLLPYIATVNKIIEETPTIKTFQVTFDEPGILENFGNKPGQCAMLSILGVGEGMISITSSPTRKGMLEFTIAKVGRLTSVIHELEVGDKMAIRGPYGNHFPFEEMKGKNCLFVAGGVGLAPLRSLIDYVLDNRDDYGRVDIVYGARCYDMLCFKYDLFDRWPKIKDTHVHVTLDREDPKWDGRVGFITLDWLQEICPSVENTVPVTCGPPIMIKLQLENFKKMGFKPEEIITTLEMNMRCGVGKCGRCNIGEKYICVDGPVFNAAQINKLPPEY